MTTVGFLTEINFEIGGELQVTVVVLIATQVDVRETNYITVV